VTGFDPSAPSIARIYDYFLGGRDNFAADRALAQRLMDLFPPIPVAVRENKQFLDYAVGAIAGEGTEQFIDLGCGLPIREQAGLTIVQGDVRDTDNVLAAVSAGIDLSARSCLIMAALLHFFPVAAGRELVARYAAALAPGSYVVLTIGLADGPAADRFFDLYNNRGSASLYKHSAADFASLFGDLPLLAPGVADARSWRPGWPMVSVPPKRDGEMIVGVAKVG
jgi:O-methyltransferase involved in polyketide biosynthesis